MSVQYQLLALTVKKSLDLYDLVWRGNWRGSHFCYNLNFSQNVNQSSRILTESRKRKGKWTTLHQTAITAPN